MDISPLNSFGKLLDKLVKFAKEKITIIMAFWLASGAILFLPIFLPPPWIEPLGIHGVPQWFKLTIGSIFLLTTSLLLVRSLFFVGTKVDVVRKTREKRNHLDRLRGLVDEYERGFKEPADCLKWAYRANPLVNKYVHFSEFRRDCDSLALFLSQSEKRMIERIKKGMSDEIRRVIYEIEGELKK